MISDNDSEVQKVINYYYKLYRRLKGQKHPRLKASQNERVTCEISKMMMEGYLMDFEEMKSMVKRHFRRSIRTDHNINHFATPGILEILMYEVFF